MDKSEVIETRKTSVAARGWRWGRIKKQNTEMFEGTENSLYDTIMMDMCDHTLV